MESPLDFIKGVDPLWMYTILFAGATHLNFKKVFVLGLLSCAIWNVILVYAGKKVGENWEIIIEYVNDYVNVPLSGIK